jgi:thiol-disulfide isomerase/thioredoxin
MPNFIKILPLFILFYSCSSGDIDFNKSNSQFKDDLDESWIVINYWADWCPPCLKEMPELVTFAESNPDIKVFSYNFDRLEPEYLDPLILRFGVDIPSITSHPREVWGIESPKILPATYFIKPGGEVVLSLLTPQTEVTLQGHLDSLQGDS